MGSGSWTAPSEQLCGERWAVSEACTITWRLLSVYSCSRFFVRTLYEMCTFLHYVSLVIWSRPCTKRSPGDFWCFGAEKYALLREKPAVPSERPETFKLRNFSYMSCSARLYPLLPPLSDKIMRKISEIMRKMSVSNAEPSILRARFLAKPYGSEMEVARPESAEYMLTGRLYSLYRSGSPLSKANRV